MGADSQRKLHLTAADFDAFLEPALPHASRAMRGSAAVQRGALRERISGWARGVVARLEQLGLAIEVVVPDELEQHISSRAPRAIAQRVMLLRDAFARASVPRREPELDPLRSHPHLALTIDSVHVEVSFEICREAESDVKNLRARIGDPTRLLELTTLFETLPDEFAIGLLGIPSFPRVQGATAEDVRALLDDSLRNGRPLWIGWSIRREVALAHSAELDDQLADSLVALAQVYKLVAWTPENDLIGVRGRGLWLGGRARASWPKAGHPRRKDGPAEEERDRGRDDRRSRQRIRKGPVRVEGSRREREDARRGAVTADPNELGRAPDGRTEVRAVKPTKGARSEAGAEDEERGASGSDRGRGDAATRPAPPRRPILPTTLRARGARPPTDTRPTIEKGTRVRVLSGPFADKVGTVQAVDGKGRAQVRLGLLGAVLDLKDLVPSTESARPLLSSSHRRPRTRGK